MVSPVLLVLILLPGAVRPAQHGERTLREELAFARELAVRYQYLDLAEKVLAELETQRLGEAHAASLALVRCQVSSEGAKREGDPEKRLATLEQAARSFREFFALPSDSELRPEAERSYVDLLSHYGRALELALAEAVGDDAAALRVRTETVLAEGLERISALLEAHDRADLSPAETLAKWRLMLDRAQMRITRGSVSANPELELELARQELETV